MSSFATDRAGSAAATASTESLAERREWAVRAYCGELCEPDRASAAAEEALASFAAERDGQHAQSDAVSNAALLRLTRGAAARGGGPRYVRRGAVSRALAAERESKCSDTPGLLAARANGELDADAGERLDSHLASCLLCRAAEVRFVHAERAFAAILAVADGPSAAQDETAIAEAEATAIAAADVDAGAEATAIAAADAEPEAMAVAEPTAVEAAPATEATSAWVPRAPAATVTPAPALPPTPQADATAPTPARRRRPPWVFVASAALAVAALVAAGVAILDQGSGRTSVAVPSKATPTTPAAVPTHRPVTRARAHHRPARHKPAAKPPPVIPAVVTPAPAASSQSSGTPVSSGSSGGSSGSGSSGSGGGSGSSSGGSGAPSSSSSGAASLSQQQSSLPSASAPQQGITPNKH